MRTERGAGGTVTDRTGHATTTDPTGTLRSLRRKTEEYRLTVKSVRAEKTALKEVRKRIADLEEAQQVHQRVAAAVQNSAHGQIAAVVSRSLEAVFGESAYEFLIDFVRARGKTEAKIHFQRDGHKVDPMSAAGGGVVDVAAFALRLASLVLERPRRRRFLALDEPFKHLSKDYHPAARDLLSALAGEMKVQTLVVTHSDGLRCGKVIEL